MSELAQTSRGPNPEDKKPKNTVEFLAQAVNRFKDVNPCEIELDA